MSRHSLDVSFLGRQGRPDGDVMPQKRGKTDYYNLDSIFYILYVKGKI